MRYVQLLLCLLLVQNASPQLADRQAIQSTLHAYANGRNFGDTALLRSSFFDFADLRFIDTRSGNVTILTVPDYLTRFKPGEKLNCTAHIEYIHISGTAAQAKIVLTYPDREFADYFNLLKKDGQWKIASKIYAVEPKAPRILIVATSHSAAAGQKTGLHFGEVARAYSWFVNKGYDVKIAAPNGTNNYLYGYNLNDSNEVAFLTNPAAMYRFRHPLRLSEINPASYDAIYLAGGHGTMWDFVSDTMLHRLITRVYENKGIVAAVCHGPAALIQVQLSNGEPLVKGKKITCFSNVEEQKTTLARFIPFFLETKLKQKGAHVEVKEMGASFVQTDERLITGQNPASVYELCEKLHSMILDKKTK